MRPSKKILLVAATRFELSPLLGAYPTEPIHSEIFTNDNYWQLKASKEVHILITGPGILLTCFYLQQALHIYDYQQIINLGVAGSYNRKRTLGEIVEVVQEEIADWGAENHQGFIPLKEMSFFDKNQFPFKNGVLKNTSSIALFGELPKVKGVTVNKVTGSEPSILLNQQLFSAETESMEGAAFLFVCLHKQCNSAQIRSLSNYVEPRNPKNWQLDLAIKQLNQYIIKKLF